MIIGVKFDGSKECVVIVDGYWELKVFWWDLLFDLKVCGL